MLALPVVRPGETLRVLCLGAHSDDIEIGAGGTILKWIASGIRLHVDWCVASAPGERAAEAESSAAAFLEGASYRLHFSDFRDSFFPYRGEAIKTWLGGIAAQSQAAVVLTHCRDDAHQDHRELSQLTWNIFRRHLVLEYEIPKWDGDLGRPNVYVPLPEAIMEKKVSLLMKHFATQRSKDWFDRETFLGLGRLRGIECRAAERYAEAFYGRKIVLS